MKALALSLALLIVEVGVADLVAVLINGRVAEEVALGVGLGEGETFGDGLGLGIYDTMNLDY